MKKQTIINRQKKSLNDLEKKEPKKFLIVQSHDKHNIIGQTIIKGIIKNMAKICTYKDIGIELSFFSKTGTLLEKDTETIYTVIPPNSSSDFKSKYYAPKATDSVVIKITGATAE